MPRVDVRTLTDPLLFRLHLVAREMLQEANGVERTNWAQMVGVTFCEISRRGFSPSDIHCWALPIKKDASTCCGLSGPSATKSENISRTKTFCWQCPLR